MTRIVYAGIALALTAGAASAQTMIVTEPVQTQTVVTTTDPLALTPVQRQTIYRQIVAQPVTQVQPTVQYRVGMRVPETAQLYSVPQPVAVEVPALQAYKYMVVNNRVVLVNPTTSEVVAELVE